MTGKWSYWRQLIKSCQRQLIRSLTIGNDVYICANSTVIGGITIGNNVIIGAGSVVLHDIPSNSIVAGNPARIIKQFN